MKIIDIAKIIDKSQENESFVDLEQLQQELDLHVYGYAEQERLKAYWVENWLCTDTCVGGRMYFFDGEPVAYSYQSARKSHEQFAWFSQEAAEKVRDFVQELSKEKLTVNICDINEDIGDSYKIEYLSEVLDWSMARYNGFPIELVEIIKDDNDYYGFDAKLKISIPSNGQQHIVKVQDLDFVFHLLDSQSLPSLDSQIQSASVRAAAPATTSQTMKIEEADKDTIQFTLSKSELDMIKASLDVMGDQCADREGYSSGEAYWGLKEKIEGFENKPFQDKILESER